MSRSVPEWVGKSDDTPIPDRVKLRVFERCNGRCTKCTRKCGIGYEPWDIDHDKALINQGQNRESNLTLLCKECHKAKNRDDVAMKAETYRVKAKHLGIKKRKGQPMPGSKDSPWKKKLTGEAVRR